MRPTIVACAYLVVLVPRQHRKSVPVIVHTSRTIQTRNQAGIVDGAVIEVSGAPRGVFGLSLALYNRCMCIPGGASTTTTSKISDGHRSHLPDHSNAQPGSLTSDGRWCSHRGLMRRGLYSLGCFWLYNRCMCTYSGGSTQDPTTTRSRRRSHLSDRSTACRCTITKKR